MKKGRVIINRNICDNAPECSGIEVCPTGALYWDEETEQIEYNAESCRDCGLCADSCPVEAILWGEDDADYYAKKKEVEDDTRRVEELVVERYGASPIDDPIDVSDIQGKLDGSVLELALFEFFSDDSINCLLHSIRIEEIKTWFSNDVLYHKVHVKDESVLSSYSIRELPALLIYKNKELLGIIEGQYTDDYLSKSALKKKITDILDGDNTTNI